VSRRKWRGAQTSLTSPCKIGARQSASVRAIHSKERKEIRSSRFEDIAFLLSHE
jgi:hypothetical protein